MFLRMPFRSSAEGWPSLCLFPSLNSQNPYPNKEELLGSTTGEITRGPSLERNSEENGDGSPHQQPQPGTDYTVPASVASLTDSNPEIDERVTKDTIATRLNLLGFFLEETDWEKQVQENLREFTTQASEVLLEEAIDTHRFDQMYEALQVPLAYFAIRETEGNRPEWLVVNNIEHSISVLVSEDKISRHTQRKKKQSRRDDRISERPELILAKETVTRAVQSLRQAVIEVNNVEAGAKRESLRLVCDVVIFSMRQLEGQVDEGDNESPE